MPRSRFQQKDVKVKLVGSELKVGFIGDGVNDWLDRQQRFVEQAENVDEFLDVFGTYMLGSIDRNFIAQGRPRRWKPLAESTVRERIRLGYGSGPILQRTGKLRRGFRAVQGKNTLKIINVMKYFQFHQQDKKGKGKIPRRVMVLMQNADKSFFTRLFNEFFGKGQTGR